MSGELGDGQEAAVARYSVAWLLAGGFSEWASTPLPPEATVIVQAALDDLCQQLDSDPEWQAWWAHAGRPYLDLSAWVFTDPPSRARTVTVA
ncbi:MAG TPA: hypothetical protein VFS29_07940 [Motilibacteraceae bacterium]|nr:hypothetical protein [Motilibacteraceae bacterium]